MTLRSLTRENSGSESSWPVEGTGEEMTKGRSREIEMKCLGEIMMFLSVDGND
jgi:hypothetical protein